MRLEYTSMAKEALDIAGKTARKLKHYHIGSEHILVALLRDNKSMAGTILEAYNVTEEDVLRLMDDLTTGGSATMIHERFGISPRTERLLKSAEDYAIYFHASQIGTEHILMAIITDDSNCAVQILASLSVDLKKMLAQLLFMMGIDKKEIPAEIKRLHKKDKEKGQDFLSQYTKDLTRLATEGKLDPVVGRDNEIMRVMQTLSRRVKNNPCLVGEPGVGKTAIVEGLARKIADGNVPSVLSGKRILSLDLSGMVAGTKYRGEFEERMKKMISAVIDAGDVILFLDEIHTLIGAGGSEGAIDASSMLKPALARGELQLIGATTKAEYRKYVEKDAALERRFHPIDVNEPNEAETIAILEGIKGNYEKHHNVTYTKEAIVACVKLSARYINDRFLPDKAIDLMDEAGALARLRKSTKTDKTGAMKDEIKTLDSQIARAIKLEAFTEAVELRRKQESLLLKLDRINNKAKNDSEEASVVTEDSISEVLSLWTQIPVKRLQEKETARLLKLEDVLHKRVIGQEEAVFAVSRAMRRQRVGLQDPSKPLGSFLFLGPTGVGKTELSKALAEAMFGDEDAIIRVDMSEYMESYSVSKMIGSPPGYVGYDEGGQLSEKVRKHPYSVVLFDEIEKAHPDVFNVLLQVLDDGHITDSKGRKVSFKNTIIIMTSNAGARSIVDPKTLGFSSGSDEKKDYETMKSSVMEEVKRLFKPEFINRIDEIIVFHALNKKNMTDIVNLLSNNLKKRCLSEMDIKLSFSAKLKDYIVEKFADKKMGARPLKRAIQTFVEDPLSEAILRGEISVGDKVTVTLKDNKAAFLKSK